MQQKAITFIFCFSILICISVKGHTLPAFQKQKKEISQSKKQRIEKKIEKLKAKIDHKIQKRASKPKKDFPLFWLLLLIFSVLFLAGLLSGGLFILINWLFSHPIAWWLAFIIGFISGFLITYRLLFG